MSCCETPYSNYDLVGGGEEPSQLFENQGETDTVKNTIGDITEGTNVSTLRTTYATLDDVVAGMLQISTATEEIPSTTGDAFTFSNANEDVRITASYPGTINATYNRGSWNNAYFANGTTPTNLVAYNPTNAIFTGAFGLTNDIVSYSPALISNTTPSSVTYSRENITGTFSNWTTYTLTGTMTSSNSSVGTVYSNYPYQNPTEGPTAKSYTAYFTRRVYKPFFVNSVEKTTPYRGIPGTEGYSGQYSTNKIFNNTSIVYVPGHTYTHTIAVPFNPVGIYEYDVLFNLWTSVNYTSVAINTTTANYLPSSETAGNSTYYLITLDQNISRPQVDVRINK